MSTDDRTVVNAEQFDRLLADVEAPGVPSEALRAAAAQARKVIVQQPDASDQCPCGHPLGDLYMCIRSRPEIYGPCPDENCGGVCEYYGDCTSPDCACQKEEQ